MRKRAMVTGARPRRPRSRRLKLVLRVTVATLLLSMCTQPFVTSVARPQTAGVGLGGVVLQSSDDLERFFDDESTTELSGNFTIDAAEIDGATSYRWSVNGDDPEIEDVLHVSVHDDSRSLTIHREAEGFENEYPVGSTIHVTLAVLVDSRWHSGSRTFVVAAQ